MKGKTHSTEKIIRILRQADGGETAHRFAVSTTSQSKRSIPLFTHNAELP